MRAGFNLSQLPLAVQLDDDALFATFFAAGNAETIGYLESLADDPSAPGAWIWGRPASGKSHLLQAVCSKVGDGAVYLPLAELSGGDPGILEGMATRACVCLDDVGAVAGEAEWERALFSLFEAAAAHATALVVSADGPQRQVDFALRDLASRFSLLPAFNVHALDDDGCLRALMLRAQRRGLDLPEETAKVSHRAYAPRHVELVRFAESLGRGGARRQASLDDPLRQRGLELNVSAVERDGRSRDASAERLRNSAFVRRQFVTLAVPGDVARTVGRAASLGLGEFRDGVGDTHEQHAVMQ